MLDTYFRERTSKLQVMLSHDEHERSIAWYRDRATVVVQGTAHQAKSGLRMSQPDRVEAWSNERL